MTDPIDTHGEDFTKIVRDAGIPTTQEEMQDQWDQINEDQGSQISNDSRWSPFWRLISAIVTTPGLWVVNFLINSLLPNSFVKTAEDIFLDILAWSLKLDRKEGVATRGLITFTRLNIQNALTIVAGTRIQSPPINGTVYELQTLEETLFPDDSLTVNIEAEAIDTGADFNLAPGYFIYLPEPVEGIVSVRNNGDWITVIGADEEGNDELRLRCRNQFTAVGQFHHDAAYRAIITEFAGLRPDYIWFEHGAPRGAGSANAYLMVESGAAPESLVEEVNDHINNQGYHGHGDDMEAFSMPTISYDLSATLYPIPNLGTIERATLVTQSEEMIRCAFRENNDFVVTRTWPFDRFSMSRLGQEMHEFFLTLDSVEFDRDDIESQMDIPVLGTLTVTLSDSESFENTTAGARL